MTTTKQLAAVLPAAGEVLFGPFVVTPHVFYQTPFTFAIVNLKPLLPGHVLVSPVRRTHRLLDLTSPEYTDFWDTVRKVSRMTERVFKADALNVAVQDGPAAGQSVPHVHCHIIPRHARDLDMYGGNDSLYQMLNNKEGDMASHWAEFAKIRESGAKQFVTVDDAARKLRTEVEMAEEALWLAREMKADLEGDLSS